MKILFSKQYVYAVLLCFLLSFTVQFTGNRAINLYSSTIIGTGTSSFQETIMFNILSSVASILGGLPTYWILERKGRRPLILAGTLILALIDLALGVCGYTGILAAYKYLILAFKFSFSISLLPVYW